MNLTNTVGWLERKRSPTSLGTLCWASLPLYMPSGYKPTYQKIKLLITLLLFGFGQHAQASPDIPAYIDFDLRLLGITIAATRISYSIDPDQTYHYQATSVPAGLFGWVGDYQVLDKSTGIVRDGQLIPSHYKFRHTRNDKPRDITLNFDWVKNRVSGVARKHKVNLPLLPGTQDQLSVQPSLIHALRENKTNIEYDVIERHKQKHYEFRIMGEETIDTVFGRLDTLRVQIVKSGDLRETILWCAPSLGYLPVQGEHIAKGFHYKLIARGIAPYSAREAYQQKQSPHPDPIETQALTDNN